MPRGRRQYAASSGPAASGGSDAVLLAADRVLSKEAEYRQGVRRIQAAAALLADRISIKGDVEAVILPSNDDSDGDSRGRNNSKSEAEEFMNEQRVRLKALCDGNAGRMRGIDDFLRAVGDVRDEVVGQAAEGETTEGGESEPPDYERSILDKIEAYRERRENGLDDEDDEEFGRDVRKRLGEKEVKKRKSRGSRGGAYDDDEELEIVQNHADTENSLKCPITAALFEQPVRNKVCGHTYSLQGLNQLIRLRKHTCPIPGCANNRLARDQVEEDVEMEMKVKRFKRRCEQERIQRLSQEEELGEEGDDQDGGIGAGMTVIE